ncbi:hypothetical protein D5086_028738 [Populus alba]|uniref:Uncharacterized protein n=1 Tax=Populus alba TaxID=43335 RepID=A0ACC4ASV4_POPAL
MLKGLCKNGFVENALVLFRNLKRHGFVPSLVTSNILINRLCKARRLKTARGYTFDGFAYCTVVGALVKTCRIEEPSHYMERMVNTGIGIEMTSYNAPINLNCKGSKLEVACEILDEMDKVGKVERISCALFVSSHPVSDTTEVSLNPFMYISRASTSAMIDGTAFHNLCHWSCNIPQVLQATT